MRIIAVIQARMGSTRLPEKVLKKISGETMLSCVVRRVKASTLLNEVVVATTLEPQDEAIVEECSKFGVSVFRGQTEDVLDRYYQASRFYRSEAVVRITSDCPLIDPELIDRVVRAFLNERPDYTSNCLVRTYPRGLDCEVIAVDALERAWREAKADYQRAHVTPYVYENPDLFRLLSCTGEADYSSYRWTVDTREDLEFIRTVYQRMDKHSTFRWRDILRLLDVEPELILLNRHIQQKSLTEGQ